MLKRKDDWEDNEEDKFKSEFRSSWRDELNWANNKIKIVKTELAEKMSLIKGGIDNEYDEDDDEKEKIRLSVSVSFVCFCWIKLSEQLRW